ncbi:MAG: DegT/DnrJ/EryC1/StrS family aminotransferase [Planctomycetaceae bacterium]|nr:DegT/DnrJ/EryC1/StrS family aminotransferase [Planctomycetales bacterium]MCB9872594.1 DegT/DnrJ/EryC1/StrS family aminotransferase [Planctomycetaceae bacterium]MCB9939580.1 DegT/DnrJ/EryC1/StrS family aminotransferase [Planctomycetaceae bacterium]HRX82076.1 DegT/DnrJ/EryC1/StrS family aminotransferase [Pirellulaceae bacterium]
MTHSRTIDPQSVPLLDIVGNNRPLHDEILSAIRDVFETGAFLHGPAVSELENSVAELVGSKHAIGCASGSDALLLALMALNIGAGDEVIVPSFTFFATASAVDRLGAKIVFVDIEPDTFNLDPAKVKAAITPHTKAIIPVHLFGRCANMTELQQISDEAGIRVIEDAAQAIGSDHAGCGAGAWGDVGCFSFYPTKNLGGCGDGGMLTTSDDNLAERLRLFAAHGMKPRYVHRVVGIASRLDTIQAAALCVKLKHLERWTESRRQNAVRYFNLFADSGLDGQIALPADDTNGKHIWNQYTIRVPSARRDALRSHLAEQRIASEIYYPIPLHQQECFRHVAVAPGSLLESERAAAEVLSLPIFPDLTLGEQQRVVEGIASYFAARKVSAA